ncbi:MAG TPA: hypothetical protein VH703_02705 [Solirubrobacterales bacterium]|jgi:hypothetical protein
MGILQVRPDLAPGEKVRWKAFANRVLPDSTTAGGRLFVTDRRVFFQPNRIDAGLGRKVWECPLAGVRTVETVGRDGHLFAGGPRKRLGIKTADSEEVFVVNRLKRKEAELLRLFPRASRG